MLHHEPTRLSKDGDPGRSRSLSFDVKRGDHDRITFEPDIGDEHDVEANGPNLHLDRVSILLHQPDQHRGSATRTCLDTDRVRGNETPRTIDPSFGVNGGAAACVLTRH
jgi:hypothetical protein